MKQLLALAALLLASAPTTPAATDYQLGPDSQPQPGTPTGTVEKFTFKTSKIYPGTERDYWVYVPKQYDAAKPAALMVFQDGGGYQGNNGSFRAPVVMDNLIHKKEMPVTIGVFINPGSVPPAEPGQKGRSNRSYEYDSMGDAYARFLLEELLPEVEAKWKITHDPAGRCTVGISSGGIAAFTVAWERPDSFGKVISHIGSFTNIRGGHVYPALIRKLVKEPAPTATEAEKTRRAQLLKLRVFLQDGSSDLDNLHGNWPLSNKEVFTALKFVKIDTDFILGDGGHSGKQGGAILPDTMRWIWRDYAK
ncbi:MAG: esterase family protein [Proteobacteria bacterium]|jgi:enterochelin esterase family protein|nr:esterase family protein [Pseudomonadota bacterium]